MYEVGKCLLPQILRQKDFSQQELAENIAVTRQQIHKYVTSDRVMTLEIAYNISKILDCSIEDLYEWKYVEERRKRR